MGGKDFEPRLESLRGIAAFIVAAHHGMITFNVPAGARIVILSTLTDWALWITNPGASVMFFFVLSGYVLGRALERNGDFFPYIIRRAFRILPMFVLSVLFAYLCVTLIRQDHPPNDATAYFQRIFWPAPGLEVLWENLTFRSFWINGPSWSIYPELLGSLFLPLLVFIHTKINKKFRWPAFGSLCTILAFTDCRLIIWFYAGFFLPPEIAKLNTRSWLASASMFAMGYLVLRFAGEFAVYYKMKTIVPSTVGATLVIGAVVSSTSFLKWLDVKPLRFVGRVSYSFYLLHWPIFYLCSLAVIWMQIPGGYLANLAICISSLVLALAASAMTYTAIELPFVVGGRKLSAWIAEKYSAGRSRWYFSRG